MVWQVNTKPGGRRAKKAGKKKKDEEHEDLDDEEQTQHDHEVEDAAGLHTSPALRSIAAWKQL